MPDVIYRLLPIITAVVLVIYLFLLVRSHRVREHYVWVWMLLGAGMFVMSLVPQTAFVVSRWLGFQTPSNMLLAACSIFLLLAVINLSTAISGLEEDRRRFVEELALMEARVRLLEAANEAATNRDTSEETDQEGLG